MNARSDLATQAMQPQDRTAHLAVRGTVDHYGEEAVKGLYLAFDWMNGAFFGGLLGAPMILVSPPRSPRAWGDYTICDEQGLASRIRIAPIVFNLGLLEALVTLLHEMVHAWCIEVEKDPEIGYKGHGPKFCAKANEIGAMLGYRKVSPRGRLPDTLDSIGWPHLLPRKIKVVKVKAIEPEAEGAEVEVPELPEAPEVESLSTERYPGELDDLRFELEGAREREKELAAARDELLMQTGDYIATRDAAVERATTAMRVSAASFEKEKAMALVRDRVMRENTELLAAVERATEKARAAEAIAEERQADGVELVEIAERWEEKARAARLDAHAQRGERVSLEIKVGNALHEARGQLDALKLNGKTSGGAIDKLRAIVRVLEGFGVEGETE